MSTGDSAELKIRLINQAKVFIKSMSTFLGISNEIETDTPSEIQAKLKIFLENQNLGDELTLEDAVSLLEDFNDSFDIKPIAKIIEEIKSSITIPAPIVNVEAPIVNLPAPIVKVDAPNVNVDTAPVAKEIIKVTALLDTILLALKRDEKQIDKVLIVDEKGNPIDLFKALKADQPMFGGRGAYEVVGVKNSTNVRVNPATEDKQDAVLASQESIDNGLILLRRMVKLLESSAVVDSAMRQRVAVENLTTFVQGTSGGLGVPSTSIPTAGAPAQASSISYIPVWTGPVDSRYQLIDQARNTYANGIRSKLSF
jgi:hypothetical protein